MGSYGKHARGRRRPAQILHKSWAVLVVGLVLAACAPAPPYGGPWPVSMDPCGGDLPPCWVKQRESGGDYNARNPSSTASGAWQFLDSTWSGHGGYPSAYLAPPEVQDERARQLWANGAGCSHWSAC